MLWSFSWYIKGCVFFFKSLSLVLPLTFQVAREGNLAVLYHEYF